MQDYLKGAMMLCGHLHEAEGGYFRHYEGDCFQFQAGCAYAGSSYVNRFQYITIDFEQGKIRLDFRAYDSEKSRWHTDAATGDEGKAEFDMPGTKKAAEKKRTKVFVSCSHEDASWLNRLKVHMQPLIRGGLVDFWDDTKIQPGMDWRSSICEAISSASVAILLISADFLASEFIVSNELPPLLEAAEREGALILPVILSPSRFIRTPSLSRFQCVNPPERPLIGMTKVEQEEVFVKATDMIQEIQEAEEQRQRAKEEQRRKIAEERQDVRLRAAEEEKRKAKAETRRKAEENEH
jgi:hypothetical protein